MMTLLKLHLLLNYPLGVMVYNNFKIYCLICIYLCILESDETHNDDDSVHSDVSGYSSSSS